MSLQQERIATFCHSLKLERIAGEWAALAPAAAGAESSYAEFVEQLLAAEFDARGERTRQALIKFATLPGAKTHRAHCCTNSPP